jgi:hypothetical protein
MTKNWPGRRSAGIAAAVVALAAWTFGATPSREVMQAPAPPACPADPAWVKSPSQPNFQIDPTNPCQFYQYAWQSFLYLVSPSSGKASPAVFETWPAVDEVFGSSATSLAAPKGAKLFTATDARSKTKKRHFFRQRVNKAGPQLAADGTPIGNEDTQAGSGGILVDQAGNITYYEQFLDPNAAVPFIKACTLTVKACQTAAGAAALRFPAASLELKISWRPLWKTTAGVRSYYLIPGSPVQNAKGQMVTPDYFGLVGFHLVYVTPGQAEMVWATFEHVDNAPTAPCVEGQSTCGQLPPGSPQWSYNNCKATTCGGVNTWPSPAPSPIPTTQAFLEYAYGTSAPLTDAAGVSGAANIAILQELNKSVAGILPAGSVWSNYSQSGAVWTLGGVLPAVPYYNNSGQPNGSFNEVGSTFLANSTMETFTQFPNPIPNPFPTPPVRQNCFSCHNSNPPAHGSFLVSHAFSAAHNPAACSWTTTPPPACLATQPKSADAKK